LVHRRLGFNQEIQVAEAVHKLTCPSVAEPVACLAMDGVIHAPIALAGRCRCRLCKDSHGYLLWAQCKEQEIICVGPTIDCKGNHDVNTSQARQTSRKNGRCFSNQGKKLIPV